MPLPIIILFLLMFLMTIPLVVIGVIPWKRNIGISIYVFITIAVIVWISLAASQSRKCDSEYLVPVKEFCNKQFIYLKNDQMIDLTETKKRIYKPDQLLKVKHYQTFYLGIWFLTPSYEIMEVLQEK